LAPKASVLGEVMQNNRHYLRGSGLFTVSSLSTNRKPLCDFLLLTYVLSHTIYKTLRSIGQTFAVVRGIASL